ncbi:MAG: hypothetical protein ROO73_00415 [Roseivirga sp.]
MKDNTDLLIYLVLSIVGLVLNRVFSGYNNEESLSEETEEEALYESPHSSPTPVQHWTIAQSNTGQEDGLPASTPRSTRKVQPSRPAPTLRSAKATIPPSATPPKGSGLSRYSGWKKAIVMQEILQPYS